MDTPFGGKDVRCPRGRNRPGLSHDGAIVLFGHWGKAPQSENWFRAFQYASSCKSVPHPVETADVTINTSKGISAGHWGDLCKPVCGGTNLSVSPGQQCNNGDAGNCAVSATNDWYNQCTTSCTLGPYCGDSVVQTNDGEQCDNGKNVDGYAAVPRAMRLWICLEHRGLCFILMLSNLVTHKARCFVHGD